MHPPIPFLDLVIPHMELEAELVSVFRTALKTAGFVGGAMVDNFEHDFAAFCRTRYCVGVGSGTDALRFALIAAGVGPGEVVLTVPNTFIATTEAITQVGATPEFVDIDEHTYNMDPAKLQQFLEVNCELNPSTGRLHSRRFFRPVSAVIPVHLYGQTADMDPILDIAEQYRLIVVEDACQAHGAEYFSQKTRIWQKAGSIGRAAAFSFYPGKNLGACGEAGAITTNDQNIATTARMLRDHGQAKKYYHEVEGYNGRLDTIQAGVLKAKLPSLAKWNQQRRDRAARYRHLLSQPGNGLVLPQEPFWSHANYHLYVVRTSDRDLLRDHLSAKDIGTGIHYPIPLHLQRAYRHLGYQKGDFPVTERVAQEILSIPLYPQLQWDQVQLVANAISEFRDSKRSLIEVAS